MATRNLTRKFQNLRRDSKGSRIGSDSAHDEWEQARRTLPPYWVDTVDECRVHIDQISKTENIKNQDKEPVLDNIGLDEDLPESKDLHIPKKIVEDIENNYLQYKKTVHTSFNSINF